MKKCLWWSIAVLLFTVPGFFPIMPLYFPQSCGLGVNPSYSPTTILITATLFLGIPLITSSVITFGSYIHQIYYLKKGYEKKYTKLIWYPIAQIIAYCPSLFLVVQNLENQSGFFFVTLMFLPGLVNFFTYVFLLGCPKYENKKHKVIEPSLPNEDDQIETEELKEALME